MFSGYQGREETDPEDGLLLVLLHGPRRQDAVEEEAFVRAGEGAEEAGFAEEEAVRSVGQLGVRFSSGSKPGRELQDE